MRKIVLSFLLAAVALALPAQVVLDSEGRDAAYVSAITGRSAKIVDRLGIADEAARQQVLNIICNRYFLLNDIHEACDKAKKQAKESLEGAARQQAVKAAEDERDAQLYKHHFEFAATLSCYLSDEQVEVVKDGLTYGVVKVTYDATLDMIPSLKAEEKAQILAWLKEAREFAMDAGTSKDKHAWFGKYKGRINNWLAKRGYDLTKERQDWYRRIEEAKKNKK